MKPRLKKTLKWVGVILLTLNVLILMSGKTYLYKAVWYNLADIDDEPIFAFRTIKAGTEIKLPYGADYNKKKLNGAVIKHLEDNKSVAFVIYRNDSLVYERYWDTYNANSRTSSFSMAKSITSVLIGCALDEGKIKSLDEPVSHYIPTYKDGMRSQLTIKHLLEMASGIDWNESYINPMSLTTEAYYGSDIPSIVENLQVIKKPGEYFNYQSSNQLVLAAVLEKATGKPLAEYMSEKLWRPLGAAKDATWSLDAEGGHEKAYCCVNSNALDFARIGMLFLNKGMWKGKRVLSEEYIKQSVSPAPILNADQSPCNHYGLSWWITQVDFAGAQHYVYYMRGILGQYVFVIPEYGMVICRLGHHRDETKSGEHRTEIYDYMKAALEAYATTPLIPN
jgi:CubicO group peptidase (beta-lactamase class C family)